jgi:hypothetical protein
MCGTLDCDLLEWPQIIIDPSFPASAARATGHHRKRPNRRCVFEAEHWNTEAADQRMTYAPISWETILPLEDCLPFDQLLAGRPHHHWNHIFSSEQELKPPSDGDLERLWADHVKGLDRSKPVTVSTAQWDIEPGTIVTRTAVAERYGGATQGGIQPSSTTPNVMIYSDGTRRSRADAGRPTNRR